MLTSSSMNMASLSAMAPANSYSRSCWRLRIGSIRFDPEADPTDVFKRSGPAKEIVTTMKMLRMNESIHEESAASEAQDRVSQLIEQQTAISEVLRAIANSP